MSREAHVRICERLGHVLSRSTRLMISIPPKYAVSEVIGYIKGKSAIHLARVYGEEAQLRGATFLGARILCFYGRAR